MKEFASRGINWRSISLSAQAFQKEISKDHSYSFNAHEQIVHKSADTISGILATKTILNRTYTSITRNERRCNLDTQPWFWIASPNTTNNKKTSMFFSFHFFHIFPVTFCTIPTWFRKSYSQVKDYTTLYNSYNKFCIFLSCFSFLFNYLQGPWRKWESFPKSAVGEGK